MLHLISFECGLAVEIRVPGVRLIESLTSIKFPLVWERLCAREPVSLYLGKGDGENLVEAGLRVTASLGRKALGIDAGASRERKQHSPPTAGPLLCPGL